MKQSSTTTLLDIVPGAGCTVHSFRGRPETCQRLRAMGFCEETVVRPVVITHSQIICELHNTRIGLHKRVASGIIVTPLDSVDQSGTDV